MIYVNGVRLWLQVSRQRSIKICSYPCHSALSSSRAKAINEMPIRSQEVVAKQAPKGRERIHGDLSGEAIEEQGCSRGSLHPARLAIVGGKRETVHWPPTTPSRAASTLGPWPSGVFYYLLFVCVQRWREQLDRKAAAALPVKGRGREGKGRERGTSDSSLGIRGRTFILYGSTEYFMSWHRIYSAREVLCGAPRSLETNDEIGILHCIWPSGTRIRQILPGCRDP